MNKKIESMINELKTADDAFYKEAIRIHNNAELREIASKYFDDSMIELTPDKEEDEDALYFGKKGFILDAPTCVNEDSWGNLPVYRSHNKTYKEIQGKLVAGRKEMLETFPDMTILKIELMVEKGLEELIKNKPTLKESLAKKIYMR